MLDSGTMMMTVFACGVGTFLLRVLPLWCKPRFSASRQTFVGRFSQAIGSAAITALLVATVLPIMSSATDGARIAGVIAALLVTYITQKCAGGIALPTLIGTSVYGLALVVFR